MSSPKPETVKIKQGDRTLNADVFTDADGNKTAIASDPDNPKVGWAIPIPASTTEASQ